MANYCFFFSEGQDREVFPESPVNDIYFTVGSHVCVQWKDNKLYYANILYIGSEADMTLKCHVTIIEQLINRFFSVSGAPPTKKHRFSSCTRNIPHNMAPVEPPITDLAVSQIIQLNNISEGFMKIHRRLDEIVIRQQSLERKCTRSVHVEEMLYNQLNDIQNSCYETAEIIQDLQKRIPRLREPDELRYTLLPATQVENIRKRR